MDEVRLAVEEAYHIVEMCEVYEYDVIPYDEVTGTGWLFAEYIDIFLKLKAHAIGYQDW
jgi:hypothetical protein